MKGKGSAVTKTVDVFIQPFGLRRRAEIGQTLYEVVRETRIELTSICGGLGLCGKCRVIVTKGQETISKPTKAEQRHLLTQELSSEIRLACQVRIQGSIEVYVPRGAWLRGLGCRLRESKPRLSLFPL